MEPRARHFPGRRPPEGPDPATVAVGAAPPERWTAARGGRVVANYTTLGPYDFVFVVELPTPEAALEGAFTFGRRGEVRTQTLRGFAPEEAEAIADRVGATTGPTP